MFGFFKKKNKIADEEIKPDLPPEQPCAQNAEFGYRLSLDGNLIDEPSETDLNKAVSTLKAAEENFVVLESGKLINGIALIQASGYIESKNAVYVEAMLPDGSSDVNRAYYKNATLEELIVILKNFRAGIAPDISGWDFGGEY